MIIELSYCPLVNDTITQIIIWYTPAPGPSWTGLNNSSKRQGQFDRYSAEPINGLDNWNTFQHDNRGFPWTAFLRWAQIWTLGSSKYLHPEPANYSPGKPCSNASTQPALPTGLLGRGKYLPALAVTCHHLLYPGIPSLSEYFSHWETGLGGYNIIARRGGLSNKWRGGVPTYQLPTLQVTVASVTKKCGVPAALNDTYGIGITTTQVLLHLLHPLLQPMHLLFFWLRSSL